MHNPNLTPRDIVKRQWRAVETLQAVLQHDCVVPCGFHNRPEKKKSEAFQNWVSQGTGTLPSVTSLFLYLGLSKNSQICVSFLQRQEARYCLAFSGLLLCHDGSVLLQNSEKALKEVSSTSAMENCVPGTSKSFGSHWENCPVLIQTLNTQKTLSLEAA